MTNVILPFLMSMMLGRTIDLRNYNIRGQNVFDDADYIETAAKDLTTTYNVIQDDILPYTYFGIPTDIAIRIKNNLLSSSSGAMGLDGILKDTSWKYNSAIVAFATLYRTVDRALRDDAVPMEDWTEKVPDTQTHYARTLFYGGWAVVLFRLKCDIASDVKFVRQVLTDKMGVVGTLNNGTQGAWNDAMVALKSNKDIRGKVSLTTQVYSTMPFRGTIETPADLIKIISKLTKRAGPVGQPLFMELRPLQQLNSKYATVTENKELMRELDKLDVMLDDVKEAKSNLMRWVLETNTAFEDEQEEKVSRLLEDVNECIRAFSTMSSDLSLFKPTDRDLLDAAFSKYVSGLENGIPKYNLAYMRLKEEIDAQCEDTFVHKIKGLLRVYEHEEVELGMVDGGLKECELHCMGDFKCRSIGYADELAELDIDTGLYHKKKHQCWIYYRSTSTASLYTPNGLYGDLGVYDRTCY